MMAIMVKDIIKKNARKEFRLGIVVVVLPPPPPMPTIGVFFSSYLKYITYFFSF